MLYSVIQDQGRASISDTHCPELAELALVPRPDRAAGGTTLSDPRQEGYAIPGGQLGVEPSCVAATGLSDKAERLAVSRPRHAHGSASTLYKMFVCLKMGSICEMVRSGSYRPSYLHHLRCSEFSAVQAG